MEEAIYTEKYKGLDIEIYQDNDIAFSPSENEDNGLFLVNYHNDFYVEKNDIIVEGEVKAWYAGEVIPQQEDYHIFILSMLSHSGVWLSLENSFACDSGGWDTSHIGIVLVAKSEAKTKAKARKLAEGLIEMWNDYLSGNVYGYMIKNAEASCWGFYGDYQKSGILDDARGEVDCYVKAQKAKHFKALKAQIKNNVSLKNRKALLVG